jgi:thiol-disulfide isomerase/thioredoxin
MRSTFLLLTLFLAPLAGAAPVGGARQMPQFTSIQAQDWLNSPPLRRADLRGKVVLLDVWTFGCWNCYRSIPWLHEIERRFAGKRFQVIGIHSPEFGYEKSRFRLAAKIAEFKIGYPVMMDNDLAYWRALHNRYWPAFYLVDKQGRLRFMHVGETHTGDRQAQQIERETERLLRE